MKPIIALCPFVCFILLYSCETVEEHRGAATGAAVGAAVGGIVGAVAAPEGKKGEGAIVGAVIGGLLGGTVGHYAYDVKRSKEETERAYAYDPRSGVRVAIEAAEVVPSRLSAGSRLETFLTYAVLTPGRETINVREVREILYGSNLWGRPEVEVRREAGTYRSSLPILLPQDMKRGTYKVRFIVETKDSRDMREVAFTVD